MVMAKLIEDVEMAQTIALRENADRRVVDCGHIAQPNYFVIPEWRERADTPGQGVTGTTGYGTFKDGRTACYPCCNAAEIEALRTAETFVAYLSGDRERVTTWPGGTLGTVLSVHVSKAARKTYVQVRDVHGAHWYGQGPAESGTYVSLRRVKVKGSQA